MPRVLRVQGSDKPAFRMLARIGLAVEHFPCYRHLEPCEQHGHDFVEFNFIVAGTTEHTIGGEVIRERAGSLGIIHYGVAHEICTGPAGAEIVNLYCDPRISPLPDLPERQRPWLGDLLPLHAGLQHRRNRVRHLHFEKKDRVGLLLAAMLREQAETRSGFESALRTYFGLFLLECARWLAGGDRRPAAGPVAAAWSDMETICQHLDADYAEPQDLASLAARVGLGRSQLCRRFKVYTGTTVFSYLIQRRIQEAMLRLRTTSDKIVAVAMACGFRDLTFFNRKFRALVGQTPGAYRRSHRQG